MKALINYIDFHWDNHQGRSGNYYKYNQCLEIPDDILVSEIFEFIHKEINARASSKRVFHQNYENKVSIQSVEIFEY